jgi:hypothetical protein
MKLTDLERVRLLSQRRQKLLNDLDAARAGELLSLELTPMNGAAVLPYKLSAMRQPAGAEPRVDDEILFDAVVSVLDLWLAKRVREVEAELVGLGVVLA